MESVCSFLWQSTRVVPLDWQHKSGGVSSHWRAHMDLPKLPEIPEMPEVEGL